jgi:hypothetical protein
MEDYGRLPDDLHKYILMMTASRPTFTFTTEALTIPKIESLNVGATGATGPVGPVGPVGQGNEVYNMKKMYSACYLKLDLSFVTIYFTIKQNIYNWMSHTQKIIDFINGKSISIGDPFPLILDQKFIYINNTHKIDIVALDSLKKALQDYIDYLRD